MAERGNYKEYVIDGADGRLMVMLGFARLSEDGEAYELTQKGSDWLQEWSQLRLRAHREEAKRNGEESTL